MPISESKTLGAKSLITYRQWGIYPTLDLQKNNFGFVLRSPYGVRIQPKEPNSKNMIDACENARAEIDNLIEKHYPNEQYPPPTNTFPLPGQPEGDLFCPDRKIDDVPEAIVDPDIDFSHFSTT